MVMENTEDSLELLNCLFCPMLCHRLLKNKGIHVQHCVIQSHTQEAIMIMTGFHLLLCKFACKGGVWAISKTAPKGNGVGRWR